MLFYIIILILAAEFVINRWLQFLNIKAAKLPLPAAVSDIYNAKKYRKQQLYFGVNQRLSIITATFNSALTIAVIALGGFGWLDEIVQQHIENQILQSLIFFGAIFFVSDLLNIPFEIYDTFVVEQRFGFNRITPCLFIIDKLKSYLIAVAVGGGILAAIMYIYSLAPDYFWLLAWGAVTVFGLFMSMFYSELIVPLFNKQTPLEEGNLRTKIQLFAEKANFKLTDIYVIDGSKRSSKANAYFAGLGKKKRIVLYDTLIEMLQPEEIVAVLAHEIGHYKHRHTLKTLLITLPFSLLIFLLLGIVLKNDAFAVALGGAKANFHLNILAFGILYTPVTMITETISSIISRRHEYQADRFAASYGLGESLVSGLKKLSATSLSNLTPHPLYVFFNYSHPTLYQRIVAVEKTKQ